MIGFLSPVAGDPSPMPGPFLIGPPYGGALGLGAPRGRSPMPKISYSAGVLLVIRVTPI